MAARNTGAAYITDPVPVLDAEAVREYEYRSLAAIVLTAAGGVDRNDPDRILWETDHDAWVRKQKERSGKKLEYEEDNT